MHIKQALLHNTVWKIFAMLFSFVSNIIIVRLLGAETSAHFFYALAMFSLLSTFLRFGLENGIVFYASKHPDRTGRLIVFIFFVTVIQVILSCAVIRYIIPHPSPFSLFWMIAFVVSNSLIWYATAFYQVKRMYISINLSAAVAAFLQMAMLCFFYFSKTNFFLREGLAGNINNALLIVLSSGLILQLLFLGIWYFRSNKNNISLRLPDSSIITNIFRYSAVNFAATVLMFLIMRADFYFVERYCSTVVLANYVQVAKIGQMALVFPGLLGGVIFPFTVNADESFSEKVSFFCRVLTLIFMILLVIFLAAGPFIFTPLLGPDFYLMFRGLAATGVGIYCLAINLILTSYFEGKNSQKIILLSNIAALVIILAGDALFVPSFGYIAAAVIFSTANFAGMIILLLYFMKKASVPVKDIFLLKNSDSFIFRFWKK